MRQKVIWSWVETQWLLKNQKALSLQELSKRLSKSVGAVRKKMEELKHEKNPKIPLLGPTKNKRSRIGKRADCEGIFFRSAWESDLWRYFRRLKGFQVEYEPKTFFFTEWVKRGQVSYTPDFQIYTPEGNFWVEVKGYMDPTSKTKLRRFKKYYPEDFLRLIGVAGSLKTGAAKFFQELGAQATLSLKDLAKEYQAAGLPGWET